MICKRTRPVLVLVECKKPLHHYCPAEIKECGRYGRYGKDNHGHIPPTRPGPASVDYLRQWHGIAKHGLIKDAFNMTTWFCDAMNDEGFADINLMHNLAPRKCLKFKTPAQALWSQFGIDAKLSFHRGVALQI